MSPHPSACEVSEQDGTLHLGDITPRSVTRTEEVLTMFAEPNWRKWNVRRGCLGDTPFPPLCSSKANIWVWNLLLLILRERNAWWQIGWPDFSHSKVGRFPGWWVLNNNSRLYYWSPLTIVWLTWGWSRVTLGLFWQGRYYIKIAQTVRISVFCSKHSGCVLPGPRYPGASHHLGSGHPGWIPWSQWQWTGQSYWNIQRDGAGHPGFPAVVCNTVHLEELSLEITCGSQAWEAGGAKRRGCCGPIPFVTGIGSFPSQQVPELWGLLALGHSVLSAITEKPGQLLSHCPLIPTRPLREGWGEHRC